MDRPPRILVAERSADARGCLADVLREDGWEVEEAADGPGALQRAQEAPPDVLLLACELDGMDGPAVARRLGEGDGTRHVPVVFVADEAKPDGFEEVLASGPHHHVQQPVDPIELVARVRAALRVCRLRQEVAARAAEVERLAGRDELTGIANRRQAQEALEARLATARRHGRPFAVALADLDHFALVNEEHGQAAGDAVLQALAGRLREDLRGDDRPVRWKEDAFLLLLADTAEAAASCERLREGLAAAAVPVPGGVPVRVTASFGWAAWRGDESAQALVERAEAALRSAKAGGRDRVVAG